MPNTNEHHGASGGQGGCGGHGVGGNGGSSVGVVYLYDYFTAFETYTISVGRGGLGGMSPINSACEERPSGQEGPSGLVMDYLCCPQSLEGSPIAECHFCPRL